MTTTDRELIYGGLEPRAVPTYPFAEAARYLKLPVSTLRSWVVGREYGTAEGTRFFEPLVGPLDESVRLLSFVNLVEAHVLCAIRREHNVRLPAVREAVDFVQQQYGVAHPLAHQDFQTDGYSLFVERYGKLINASERGQIALKEVIRDYLERIDRDEQGLIRRLYPFTRPAARPTDPKVVVIDPRVSFGKPVLAGTGLRTAVVAERFAAGEAVEELARDYTCDQHLIQEAIRVEQRFAA
jgi:uncharacterized protein (DUF433 family)